MPAVADDAEGSGNLPRQHTGRLLPLWMMCQGMPGRLTRARHGFKEKSSMALMRLSWQKAVCPHGAAFNAEVPRNTSGRTRREHAFPASQYPSIQPPIKAFEGRLRLAPPRRSAGYCVVGAPCSRRFFLSHIYCRFDCYGPPAITRSTPTPIDDYTTEFAAVLDSRGGMSGLVGIGLSAGTMSFGSVGKSAFSHSSASS